MIGYQQSGTAGEPSILFFEHDPADLTCDLWDVCGLTIAEDNNPDFVVDVTLEFGDKSSMPPPLLMAGDCSTVP